MKKEDYEEVKHKFAIFLECWEKGCSKDLHQCMLNEVECYMSVEGTYPEGGRHGIIGVSNFIDTLPDTSVCRLVPYNFTARFNGKMAQQSAVVLGIAGRASEIYEVCKFSCIFSNEWILQENEWKMKSMRLDVCHVEGMFVDYYKEWYFEEKKAKWHQGVHLPVISGELDNPWHVVKENEVHLSDQELIEEKFSQYAFGIDLLSFDLLEDVLGDDCVINMAPFGAMDKREFMQTLKLHRQPDLHWIHPVKTKNIKVHGNYADAEFYRMAGHKQRYDEIEITEKNIDIDYACARYVLKFRKEHGNWKICKFDYFLGSIQL